MSTPPPRVLCVAAPAVTGRAAREAAEADPDVGVLTASRPTDALAVLAGASVDCVVADAGTLAAGSPSFLERLRTRWPMLPVVLYGDGDEAVRVGVDAQVPDDDAAALLATVQDLARTPGQPERRGEEWYVASLSELHVATRGLLQAETEADAVAQTTDAARDVLGYPVNGVRLVDADGESLVPAAITDERRAHAGEPPVYAVDGRSPPAIALRTGEVQVYDDVRTARDGEARGDLRAAMYLPLGDHGTLSIATTRTDPFTQSEVTLAEILATNAGLVFDRIEREKRVREREATLRDERDRNAALFENTTDAIAFCEWEGDEPVVRAVNPAFEDVFGYPADAVVGEVLDGVIVPDDADYDRATTINRRVRAGQYQENEVRRLTAQGPRDFLLRSVPIRTDGEAETAYAVYTDITDRKEQQQRLSVLNRVLRHNLRNEMNIILGLANELGDDVDTEAGQGRLDRLTDTARNLVRLSQHARALADTLSRRHAPTGTVDLAAVVAAAVTEVATEFPDADCSTAVEGPLLVAADDNLDLAVQELLRNAVAHNDADRPTVRVAADADEETVTLRVQDDGPGIPDDERVVLTDAVETPLDHGSGIGLWLVRWVVEASGGSLSLSEDDDGTTVAVRLQRAAGEDG